VHRRSFLRASLGLLSWLLVPRVVRSEEYLTVEEAQALLLPGRALEKVPVRLTKAQQKEIARASDQRVRHRDLDAWRAADGSWFLVDEVIGKHEFITWAIGLDPEGAVKGLEVLTYRETYGYEIRRPEWRAQFHGKTASDPVEIDRDIENISGATLSCVHITNGVRRILQTYALVLRDLAGSG
jgi:Na+-translocating ferredoxin:NAD+ oxidoreductase RnfG subunit